MKVSRNQRGSSEITTALVVAVIVAVVVVIAVLAVKSHNKWEAECEAKGGHVDSSTQTATGTGVSSDGKVGTVTTTSTTYYCLSDDGGILGVE